MVRATGRTKAWHHRHRRVALQESCPQNNFRRIIAALVPEGEFCNHVINYFPEPSVALPLEALLALLNCKLSDWYFRIGSTNAHVNHYQLYSLPSPRFASDPPDQDLLAIFESVLQSGTLGRAFEVLVPLLDEAPFVQTVVDCIVKVVERIIEIETERGEIARSDRSSLAAAAQPLQDLLDRIFFRMAGLTDEEATGLEERLAKML